MFPLFHAFEDFCYISVENFYFASEIYLLYVILLCVSNQQSVQELFGTEKSKIFFPFVSVIATELLAQMRDYGGSQLGNYLEFIIYNITA